MVSQVHTQDQISAPPERTVESPMIIKTLKGLQKIGS